MTKGWRRQVLLLSTLALYLGVLLTGMALPFGSALPIGLALLLSYNALLRPSKEWAPNGPAFVLALVILAVISALLVWIGSLLGSWLGLVAPWLGPGLAIAGVLLARSIWSARKASEMDAFLDDALAQMNALGRDVERDLTNAPQPAGLNPELAERLEQLMPQLADLPQSPDERAAALAQLVAPLAQDWSDLLSSLAETDDPALTEAMGHLLLVPGILPQAFGHPEVDPTFWGVFVHQTPLQAEAAAIGALQVDLDASECWRLLPPAEVLAERARSIDDPAALTALAAALAERESEDQLIAG